MKTGAELIRIERLRQITKENFSPKHDDGHDKAEILSAALAYGEAARRQHFSVRGADLDIVRELYWPWDSCWWKPSGNPVRNLIKAGALIAAEIDRLQRVKK